MNRTVLDLLSIPVVVTVFGMIHSPQEITDAALKLPEQDRVRVTAALWKSLGGNEEALADIAALARAHELDSGKVEPKSQAEVFGNARRALG